MRNSVNCPFLPGSDVIPPVWAGRVEQISDWRDVLRPQRMAGGYSRGRLIVGESGSGKSSLVRRIVEDAEARGDVATPQIRIARGSDPIKVVAKEVLALADKLGLSSSANKQVKELLSRVNKVAVMGVSVALSDSSEPGPEPYVSLTELIVAVAKAACDKKRMVIIHVDEVQNITDDAALSQLLIALGDALSYEMTVALPEIGEAKLYLPLAVYLTGLPEFREMAGGKFGATFTRRFQTTTLHAISDDDTMAALQEFVVDGWPISGADGNQEYVHMEQAAQREIVRLSCGEPFLFQLAGEAAWLAASSEVITLDHVHAGWRRVSEQAASHVQQILDRLPDREREFVEMMADLDAEHRTPTRVARELGREKASDEGTTARRLESVRGIIKRGRPYTFRHRAVEAYLTSGWPEL